MFRNVLILPVFAGMVPTPKKLRNFLIHSPRIRGDGPCSMHRLMSSMVFSPYSRGWSVAVQPVRALLQILPVFAGMVRSAAFSCATLPYSPRIRGDGPQLVEVDCFGHRFSPYSRGWSGSPVC